MNFNFNFNVLVLFLVKILIAASCSVILFLLFLKRSTKSSIDFYSIRFGFEWFGLVFLVLFTMSKWNQSMRILLSVSISFFFSQTRSFVSEKCRVVKSKLKLMLLNKMKQMENKCK